jgi:hypothetical protein
MARLAARGALALVLVAVVFESAGLGQPKFEVTVFYRDHKDGSEKYQVGDSIKVTPAGVEVIDKGTVKAKISPADIIRVDPGDVPGIKREQLTDLLKLEKDRKWEDALKGYADLQKSAKAANAPKPTLQLLEFRVAYLTARVADVADDDGRKDDDGKKPWDDRADDAQKRLGDYLLTYPPTGWEVWLVTRTRAWLLLELGKLETPDGKPRLDGPAEAAAAWAKLIDNKDLPPDLQREAALHEIDCLIRSDRRPEASDRIKKLKDGAAGPLLERLNVYAAVLKVGDTRAPAEAAALQQWLQPIQALIDQAKDPTARAVGYNMIGELLMRDKRPRDAMWAYLWVETVYNQDRDEVGKALVRLVKSFEDQGDEERARSFREKLRRHRVAL